MPAPLPTAPHVSQFFHRLDEWLVELPTIRERQTLLSNELRRFEKLYGVFQGKAARNEPTSEGVDAWDFEETISGLARRLAQVAS